MINEYTLLQKIRFELECEDYNLSKIVALLISFVNYYNKSASTLLNLNKVSAQVQKLSTFIDIIKEKNFETLIEYCEKKQLTELSRKLCILIINHQNFKFQNLYNPNDYLSCKIHILIKEHLKDLYFECNKHKTAKKEIKLILTQKSIQEKTSKFLKNKLLTFNGFLFLSLTLYVVLHLLITSSLEEINLSYLINSIDITSLVLRAKFIIIFIFTIATFLILSNSMPINQILLERKMKGDHIHYACNIILKFIIQIIIVWLYYEKYSNEPEFTINPLYLLLWFPLFFIIDSLFFTVIITFDQNNITYKKYFTEKTTPQFIIITIHSIPLLIISALIFSFIPDNKYSLITFFCIWVVTFIIYILIHLVEILNYAYHNEYFSRIYVLFSITIITTILYISRSPIFTLINAGYSEDIITLVNIEMSSDKLADKLRTSGVPEIQISSKNIYENERQFKNSILNYQIDSESNICHTMLNRTLLANLIIDDENKPSNDILQNESSCFNYINKTRALGLQKYNWNNLYFSVQKESENLYNYWIYGFNVPFFIHNKFLSIKAPKINFIIGLEENNDMKFFEISQLFKFNNSPESNMQYLTKKFNDY